MRMYSSRRTGLKAGKLGQKEGQDTEDLTPNMLHQEFAPVQQRAAGVFYAPSFQIVLML